MKTLALMIVMLLQSSMAGRYEGTWASDSGSAEGKIRVSLNQDGGAWLGEAGFSMSGSDVPCKVKRVELKDGTVTVAYEFELEGYALVSTLTGRIDGENLSGTYKTTTADGAQQVDVGTWKTQKR